MKNQTRGDPKRKEGSIKIPLSRQKMFPKKSSSLKSCHRPVKEIGRTERGPKKIKIPGEARKSREIHDMHGEKVQLSAPIANRATISARRGGPQRDGAG